MDECSLKAHEALKAKGKLGNDALSVLNLFRRFQGSMTARDAFGQAQIEKIDIDFNGVRSRITELTDGELLRKSNKVRDIVTGKLVNTWEAVRDIKEEQLEFFLLKRA